MPKILTYNVSLESNLSYAHTHNRLIDNIKGYDWIYGAYGYNGVISTTRKNEFIVDFYYSFNNFCEENKIITAPMSNFILRFPLFLIICYLILKTLCKCCKVSGKIKRFTNFLKKMIVKKS